MWESSNRGVVHSKSYFVMDSYSMDAVARAMPEQLPRPENKISFY